MSLLRVLASLLTVCAFNFGHVVRAQFAQDYIVQSILNHIGDGFTDTYFYQPDPATAMIEVINLAPQRVFPVYNCYYIRDICKNANNVYNINIRGATILHPKSGLSNNVFGYNFNTGKKVVSPRPTARALLTTNNQIGNEVLPNGQVRESRIRYSCDEFPPATWVEGGDNRFNNDDDKSQTRCAAIRCGNSIAEQDWQGTAHSNLQFLLNDAINRRNSRTNGRAFPNYDPKNSVALFGFGMFRAVDGIAARVFLFDDVDMTQLRNSRTIEQALERDTYKAVQESSNSTSHHGQSLSMEELEKLIKQDCANQFLVPANDSEAYYSTADMKGSTVPMSWMGMNRWTDGDLDTEDDTENVHTPYAGNAGNAGNRTIHYESPFHKATPIKRQAVPNLRFDPPIAPLLKNSSVADIEKARSIVRKAIAESSKENQARLLNPLRNNYKLKPGTITGDTSMKSINDAVKDGLAIPHTLHYTHHRDSCSRSSSAPVVSKIIALVHWLGILIEAEFKPYLKFRTGVEGSSYFFLSGVGIITKLSTSFGEKSIARS
ncbi:hypothetical protein BCR34DRAFT_588693 [Clohesyomyces aquaticus]|uniref:Uncharacterized protein n=1 Tax=Clohesyomyces aquaticus TaxID=1231657 RepID=A0A1Y1ZK11_9PLEO|nr:hypothetical protein BCR34DRAFT_588693 [Clohesyomyces aquaticus]